ncbi:hypothetical protein GJAV_G00017460, partial [Gymnothorax javanicus]
MMPRAATVKLNAGRPPPKRMRLLMRLPFVRLKSAVDLPSSMQTPLLSSSFVKQGLHWNRFQLEAVTNQQLQRAHNNR